nr:unnamed protein product [Spirometra erinaceieuropaei]
MFAKPSLEQPMFLFEKDRQNGCGLFCVGIRICIRQNALLTWKLAGGAPPTVRWVRIFVAGRGWGERRVGEFVVREGLWREPAPLAVKRARHAATVVEVSTAAADVEETLIGVFGASMGGILVKPMSSCEVYDVRLDRMSRNYLPHQSTTLQALYCGRLGKYPASNRGPTT